MKTPATVTLQPKRKGQKKITFKKGGLHESTGTPVGQTISASKRSAAKSGKYGEKAEKQELFAENVLKGRGRKKKKSGKIKKQKKIKRGGGNDGY